MRVLVDFRGQPVRLTDERLAHILEHPEMISFESALEETLKEPEFVKRSKSDPNTALYYRFCTNTTVGDKWLCIVVKFLIQDAFILTAYLTDKIKQGESL